MNFVERYKIKKHNAGRRVIVDNFSHPTFMLYFIYISHVLNTKHKADIYFIDDEDAYSCKLYRELGFIPISLKQFQKPAFKFRYTLHYFFDKLRLKFYNKTLLDINISKMYIGDLLIDSVMRYGDGKFDLDFNSRKYYGNIKNAYYHYHKNLALLKKYSFTDSLLSHLEYIYFGILPRLGMRFKMRSFILFKAGIFKLEDESELFISQLHATEPILNELMKISKETLDNYLKRRFDGKETLMSIDFAFQENRRRLTRAEFIDELDLDPNLPICTIYLHAFGDANHYEQKMIYKSYWEWCIETINMIMKIKNVNWVVKDHPFCYIYDESAVIPNLLAKYNIKYVPNDINSKSILEISDSIVTVRGTVGLEAPYFNIKPILAGYSYYCMYGFTINCETREEYKKALSSITFKTTVSEEHKDIAARMLYWHADLIVSKSDIIDFNLNWDSEKDSERLFNHYLEKIEKIGGIENDFLYKDMEKFFAEDKKSLTGLGIL